MKLIALNESWAIFEPDKETSAPSTSAVLNEMLKVKTQVQWIDFLSQYVRDPSFAHNEIPATYSRMLELEYGFRINLESKTDESLLRALNQFANIDYLDSLVLEDFADLPVYWVSYSELKAFKEIISNLFLLSAVATGSLIPSDLFKEVYVQDIYDEKWICETFKCSVKDIAVLCLSLDKVGAGHHMLFGDEIFEMESYFYDGSDKEKHPVYIDWCEEQVDGAADYSPLIIYKAGNLNSKALRELAGEITVTIMNSGIDFLDQRQFMAPLYEKQDSFDRYQYHSDTGFIQVVDSVREWWLEKLYAEAIRLILDSKVSVCPVCESPFLRVENRGRYSRNTCSASCKTKLSQQRRTQVISNALRGIPIEDTIEDIGVQFKESIVRWYEEADKTNI